MGDDDNSLPVCNPVYCFSNQPASRSNKPTHLHRRLPCCLQRGRAQGVQGDVVDGPDARVRGVAMLGQVDAGSVESKRGLQKEVSIANGFTAKPSPGAPHLLLQGLLNHTQGSLRHGAGSAAQGEVGAVIDGIAVRVHNLQ